MTVVIDGGAGVTFPDSVQQTNALTITGGTPRYYAARAWANVNGSGGAAIRAQANVGSVDYLATGRYRINFATAMPDANYAVVATAGYSGSLEQYVDVRIYGTPTASSFTVMVTYQNSGSPTWVDAQYLNIVVFR